MLDKERFLAIKKLARDIRKENKKVFKSLEKEPMEVAIEKKNEFIDSVIANLNIAFGEGEQGREERQIFRANVLIPDDLEFYDSYSKDKNIRNLMNKYTVSIEDVMSKITELNIYGKYIDNKEVENPKENAFVEEMVNVSQKQVKEAESLLDEIETLSAAMEDITPKVEKTVVPEVKPEVKTVKENESKEDEKVTTSFDDITSAINGFINDYNANEQAIKEKDKKILDLEAEINNMDNKITEAEDKNRDLAKENNKLERRIKDLEEKLEKSTAILNQIYNSIPKK